MNYNILIIDDKNDVFERYKNALSGYPELCLIHVKHGPAAIEKIRQQKIHLIFLDQIFNDKSIPVDKLYWNNSGSIDTCSPDSDREYITSHIENQGLYIIQKINTENYEGSIIFVTDVADKEESYEIWNKVRPFSAIDYIPKSTGLTEENLTSLIKRYLKIPNLRSLRQEISSLIKDFKNLQINREALINLLEKEALSRRRNGISFVKEVIREVSKEHFISHGTLTEVINKISNKDEWQFEEINSRELLEWVLSKCDSLKKYKAENWDYEGTNGVRYGYRYRNGNEVFYLRIVHPRFASNIQDINSLKTNSSREGYFGWVDLDKNNYELESNDPYWQGNQIIIYLEKGNNGALIKEYVSEKAPLDSKDIKEILEKTKTIICASEPEWHGAISIESIYIENEKTYSGQFGSFKVEENIKITIRDYPLYNLLNEEGRNAIMGLSLGDKKKRDIQAFGRVADLLVSGVVGESVDIPETNNAYFSFVNQCTTGAWDMTQPIPDSPSHVRIIPRGSFRSGLEEQFFYRIKMELVKRKCASVVFMNANIKIAQLYPKTNEADFIICLPNKIYWIDIKGIETVNSRPTEIGLKRLTDGLKKLSDLINDFRNNVLNKISIGYGSNVDGMIILPDNAYANNKIRENINGADERYVTSFTKFCNEIDDNVTGLYDLTQLENKLTAYILSSYDSPYESSEDFIRRFGDIISSEKKGKEYKEYDELHTKKYYIRRYSMLHALNIDDVKYYLRQGIAENKLSEKISNYKLSDYFLLPILPDGTIFVDRGGNPIPDNLVEVKAEKDRIKIYVRWIYKFYEKPDNPKGPLLLKNCTSDIQENEKGKLLYHYFKAIDTLSMLQINDNINIGFDENSLKVFKKGNTYTGVLEPLLNNRIQDEDVLRNKVLSIINILNPVSFELQLYKNEVNASRDNLRSLIKKYIDSYENKDKFDEILTGVNELRTYIKSNEKHGKSKKPENPTAG